MRGATLLIKCRHNSEQFQFTLPCGERPELPYGLYPLFRISIHAPVRGATNCIDFHLLHPTISIHAPVRGATFFFLRKTTFRDYFNSRSRAGSDCRINHFIHSQINFNSRSRAGSDSPYKVTEILDKIISIHAPVRGATILIQFFNLCRYYFNSRSRAGSDSRTHNKAL